MDTIELTEVSVPSTLQVYPGSHLDEDLIIFDDFSDIPLPNEPRRMQALILALCLDGKAQYNVDTVRHQVNANDIMIISEGQVTDEYMLSRDCHGFAFMISYEFFNEIVKSIHELSSLFLFSRSHPVCHMLPEEVEVIKSYFKMIKARVEDPQHHFRKDAVRSLFTSLIYDISNAIYRIQKTSDIKRTRAEAIFTNFIKLVEQNFKNERRVGWYAQQLCITAKYLSEVIKQISHRTPSEWIEHYVTLEIRVLLKNSTKSIKEITRILNFPNQSFLGKYFKEHVGMSPSAYRKT